MWRAIAISLSVALGLCGTAVARTTVDVPRRASLVIVGEHRSDAAGGAVARAGDVNGDGHGDVIVGAPLADPHGRKDAGAAYVVFGPLPRGRLQLAALGARGFRIDGSAPLPPGHARYAGTGFAVAAAGDVNADGLGDLIFSTGSMGSFVVFGKRDAAAIDLAAIGSGGFRFLDTARSGRWPAGDMNADGVPDFALATDIENDEESGIVWIRYGSAAGTLGGFDVTGAVGGMYLGAVAAPAGDVNRDGYADLLIAAPPAGSVFVLYGRPDAVDVSITPGEPFGGRQIDGPQPHRSFGYSIARYGRGLVAGAPGRTLQPGHPGSAWIMPAQGDPVRLAGPRTGGPAGLAVDVPGDILGGPAREVLVEARGRWHGPGKSLLFSRSGRRLRTYSGTVNAGRIRAPAAGAGDVGGSPRPDLLLGSPGESVAYVLTRP